MDMKPTQEQVIAWAREAGSMTLVGGEHSLFGDAVIKQFAVLAYSAGRKDENEAVEKEINKEDLESLDDEAYCILVALLAWVRARREQ